MGMNSKPVLTESFISTNDLSAKQFYAVKLSANRTVILPTADTDICIGILLNKPNAGEVALVMVIGRTPVVSDEALAYGVNIYIASGGKAKVIRGNKGFRQYWFFIVAHSCFFTFLLLISTVVIIRGGPDISPASL